jgi:PAS domain-containing protein
MLTAFTLMELEIVVFVALATAGVLYVVSRKSPHSKSKVQQKIGAPSPATTICFDFDLDGELTCSNESGASLMANLEMPNPNWSEFRDQFIDRFSTLPVDLKADTGPKVRVLSSNSIADPMELELERHKDGVSISMRCCLDGPPICTSELHLAFSSLKDLDLIRAVSEHAPYPVWQSHPDGSIGWKNSRYKALDEKIERLPENPDAPLFSLPERMSENQKPTRLSVKDKGHNRTYWFDISHRNFGDSQLNFAMDIHAVVNAESAQRNFVQTLAKTFAHLTTGLAIFDRNRQLMLFNPSLIDLTELRPEFLTARPNLFSFFDQLRDNQVMPEPKSYASWRERIADMISAASDDNFNETWHLPNGLTYRITGRPHPDGAIAFLFEDISAEISLTRRFRSEASVTRSALDALGDNLAIFNSAGLIQQCNRPMMEFMELDEDYPVDQMSVQDMTRHWQEKCLPSPVWGEIRDFISGQSDRETWGATLHHKDGRSFSLQVSPVASGATLVTLSTLTIDAALVDTAHKKSKRSKTVAA